LRGVLTRRPNVGKIAYEFVGRTMREAQTAVNQIPGQSVFVRIRPNAALARVRVRERPCVFVRYATDAYPIAVRGIRIALRPAEGGGCGSGKRGSGRKIRRPQVRFSGRSGSPGRRDA
jgi:hypothetical protein